MKRCLSLGVSLLFASAAQAQNATGGAPDPARGLLLNLPIFLALFGLFYFGVIHPQKNQQKKQQEFLSKLQRGDEVVTSSGIIGTVRGLTDRVVTLEVSPNAEIKILRSQVQGHLKDSTSNS